MLDLKNIKAKLRVLMRLSKDVLKGNYFKFAGKYQDGVKLNYSISIRQEIKQTATFENKIFNLILASKSINQYMVMPNEIFSFWKIIGNPNHNYKKGRALINGNLQEETGGGLCQISGIIYHISLLAGLQILERHNHSVDIYTEETRFTPLGTDATIVYGYKDLRIRNNFDFKIKFEIAIDNNFLIVNLLSSKPIIQKSLTFEHITENNYCVTTITDQDNNFVNQSKYRKNSF